MSSPLTPWSMMILWPSAVRRSASAISSPLELVTFSPSIESLPGWSLPKSKKISPSIWVPPASSPGPPRLAVRQRVLVDLADAVDDRAAVAVEAPEHLHELRTVVVERDRAADVDGLRVRIAVRIRGGGGDAERAAGQERHFVVSARHAFLGAVVDRAILRRNDVAGVRVDGQREHQVVQAVAAFHHAAVLHQRDGGLARGVLEAGGAGADDSERVGDIARPVGAVVDREQAGGIAHGRADRDRREAEVPRRP